MGDRTFRAPVDTDSYDEFGFLADVATDEGVDPSSVLPCERFEVVLDDDTMIVFTSDNGGVLRSGAWNGPHKAGKASPWEGGQRVPGIFWFPGRVPAGSTTDEIASHMDFLPTFAALAASAVAHVQALME